MAAAEGNFKQRTESAGADSARKLSVQNELAERYNILIRMVTTRYSGNNREQAGAEEFIPSIVREIEQILGATGGDSPVRCMTNRYVAYHTQRLPVEMAVVVRLDRGEWRWLLFRSKPKPAISDSRREADEWLRSNGIGGVSEDMNAVVDIIRGNIKRGERDLAKIKRTGTSSKIAKELEESIYKEKRSLGFVGRF